jgi:hypothetical protein
MLKNPPFLKHIGQLLYLQQSSISSIDGSQPEKMETVRRKRQR